MKAVIIILSFLVMGTVQAGIVVIAHPANSNSVTVEELQRLYTGKSSSFANGDAVLPLNLTDANTLRGSFDEKALGRSSSQIKAYWSKLVFTGKGTPPKEVSSDEEMIKLVSSNPNILGYVGSDTDVSAVKVLLKID
ncbi:phosphate ABC transporter substrate-binding protein [Rheinheimera maricola]|uniref:Phosphate ABC transporter substrate-binding protein n=1 Tax=Rheinheimera maricola TaxID=2793282 RepID=A0ABS7X8J2_9GAMM|nr:phosphate ABC transporter substrate-binding protein [Rheinheimera maricola]MBZ9611859.1 phosphate ABC transporter substrate-binding protein [Rheinheimera maricola]